MSYKCEAIVVHCMDYRLQSYINQWPEKNLTFGSHDRAVISSGDYAKAGPVMAFHTSDGGETWVSEVVPVLAGPVYLARENDLLTVITRANQLTLLKYTE